MRDLNASQLALLAADTKTATWLFDIQTEGGTSYFFSTKDLAGGVPTPSVEWHTDFAWDTTDSIEWADVLGSHAYDFKIVDFNSIKFSRTKTEYGIVAPSSVSLSVLNSAGLYAAASFVGGTVQIALRLVSDDTEIDEVFRVKFLIEKAEPDYGKIRLTCTNYWQKFLDGFYPNTDLIKDLFPSSEMDQEDKVCVPVVFGNAYIPLRSVYITNARYYVLGPAAKTYTISKVRSPRDWGRRSEWESSDGYAFTQSDKTDSDGNTWRVFQPIIADANLDGTADSCGLWRQGEIFLDMPTAFTRSDTATLTNPADVIKFVLKDMGVPDSVIDNNSFTDAADTFDDWGLRFDGGFWYKRTREETLATLLNMCHATIFMENEIRLQVLSKTSVATLSSSNVLRKSFRYSTTATRLSDSAYMAWQGADEAQDQFHKVLVPTKTTSAYKSDEVVELPMILDSQDAQTAACLALQRMLLKIASVRLQAKSSELDLMPDDVVTVSDTLYGGTYNALVDSMTIGHGLAVDLELVKFLDDLDDWEDLTFDAITLADDTTEDIWEPAVSGPLSGNEFGRVVYDNWGKAWLVVSSVANAGEYTSLASAITALPLAGGSILIKNGTYTASDVIDLPDKNIEIMGESEEGVILRNAAGKTLLRGLDIDSSIRLSAFTIQSANISPYSTMVDIHSTAPPRYVGKIFITELTIQLQDDGTYQGDGDVGISIRDGVDSIVQVDAVTVTGGKKGVAIESVSPDVKVKNCLLTGQTNEGTHIHNCPSYEVRNNRIEDFVRTGVRLSGLFGSEIVWDADADWHADFAWDTGASTADHGTVMGNRIICADDDIEGDLYGILLEGSNISITENLINMIHERAANSETYGIYSETGGHKKFTINEIVFGVAVASEVSGIRMSSDNDCIVQGNTVRIDQTDFTELHVGIDLEDTSVRNIVSTNNIDLVYDNVMGYGIEMGASTQDNSGTSNLTYNAGTSVVDLGTDNDVTATDV